MRTVNIKNYKNELIETFQVDGSDVCEQIARRGYSEIMVVCIGAGCCRKLVANTKGHKTITKYFQFFYS